MLSWTSGSGGNTVLLGRREAGRRCGELTPHFFSLGRGDEGCMLPLPSLMEPAGGTGGAQRSEVPGVEGVGDCGQVMGSAGRTPPPRPYPNWTL